jgi:hypothetical protein
MQARGLEIDDRSDDAAGDSDMELDTGSVPREIDDNNAPGSD